MLSIRGISLLPALPATGQTPGVAVLPRACAKVGSDGGQTSRQPPQLCGVFACNAVSTELVYKFNGACDRCAIGAVRCGHFCGGGATVVRGDTGGANVTHDVCE